MRLISFAALLLLTAACASQQVSVTNPTTPPENGQVSGPATPAPTSTNTVDPVPARVAESDTTARPPWLKARIAEVLAERKRNPITRILRYDYEGRKVYYISAPCCDQFSNVYDTRGKLICQPDGGITGKGDGKCPDFEKRKTNEKLVWQDPR
ncbi:DUF6970 domain-containing protein [Hymenobacter convexus]|uniref:DUF6970 domain-containing protein n=1 Tax=Hymenobacter sp. CA1UV-4 TaxID=3063782 RepID=UPI0027131F9A|nr:hypothetical protein [Hymenobacter sp. CA1UV-4]MDO7850829.1 hypothetical protein [Hymenobacter sp. CA1UV-4]